MTDHRPPHIRVVDTDSRGTASNWCEICGEPSTKLVKLFLFDEDDSAPEIHPPETCPSCLREALALVEPSEAAAPPALLVSDHFRADGDPGAVASGGSLVGGGRRVFEGTIDYLPGAGWGLRDAAGTWIKMTDLDAAVIDHRGRRVRVVVDVLDEPSAGKEAAR